MEGEIEEKKVEASLGSYTLEELANNSLPNNLENHPHPISLENGKDEYSQTIENLSVITTKLGSLEGLEGEKYSYAGSMAMYLLWNDLMEQRKEIDIKPTLNQRIKGGKNDCDLAVEPNRQTFIMETLKFNDTNIEQKRGLVEGHMIDILARAERPSFPNEKVQINGKEILVQNPYFTLLEKVSVLAFSLKDEEGNEVKKQIKWGVDLKLYKLYIQLSENISEDELNQKLKDLWPKYKSEERFGSLIKVLEGVSEINSQNDESLLDYFQLSYPDVSREQIIKSLNSVGGKTFTDKARRILKAVYEDSASYQEAFERAEKNYKNLLPTP